MQGCNATLWNRNYVLLILSNLLLYVSVYSLIPVLPLPGKWTAAFCFALPLLGLFNNYMVDSFKRKNVFIIPVFLLSVCTFLYVYATDLNIMLGLRIVQGALFGLALMASGSTLAIDVTPGCNRNAANFYFAWSGVIGMLLGMASGFFMNHYLDFKTSLLVAAGLSLASLLLVAMISVSFRAPLELSFVSFDRFILPRTLLPGLNMMMLPIVIGILVCLVTNPYFYISMAVGTGLFLFIRPFIPKTTDGRLLITMGNVLACVGLVLLLRIDGAYVLHYLSGVTVGLGLSLSLLHCLRMMILLPEHCERGTGFHTLTILWEMGVGVGLVAVFYHYSLDFVSAICVAILILGIGGLFYLFITHPYYIKALKNRIQNY